MADELPPAAASPDPSATPPPAEAAAAAQAPSNLDASSIEELLKQASFDDPATLHPPGGAGGAPVDDGGLPIPDLDDFKLPSFQQVIQDAQASSIELLRDVELNVKIELGRSRMLVVDVLKLAEGSVVELDKLAGDPVDVFVNDRLVARGEVLVLNDNFCVRVNEIVTASKEEGL